MFGLCVMIILIAILICVTIIGWKILDDYNFRDILMTRNKMMTVKNMICQKAEIGDKFSNEEIRVMYELLTKK